MNEPATKPSKSALFLIFVTVFIDLLGFGIVLPLMAPYAKEFGASRPMLATLMASFSVMQFVFAPLWGRLSDRIGRRPVLLVGLAGSTAFYAMFGFINSWSADSTLLGAGPLTWLLISRIGAGICGATIPTAQAYIADITGAAERTKGMALVGAAFGIGFTFGPLIGAIFVTDNPSDGPTPGAGYVASALSGLAFLWALAKLPESLRADSIRTEGHFRFGRLLDAFRHPGLALVLATVFLTTMAFGQFETTLSLLTKSFKLPYRQIFYVYAYVGFVLSLTNGGLVRPLSKRVAPHALALMGAIVMTAGMLLMASRAAHCTEIVGQAKVTIESQGLSEDSVEAGVIRQGQLRRPMIELYIAMAVIVVGYSTLTPSVFALISLRTPSDKQGEYLGVAQSMSAMARIGGPIIGVSLLTEAHPERPYYAGAALMTAGIVMVWMLRRGPKCSAEVAAGA